MGVDLQAQWDAVTSAPLLYLAALIVVGGAIWGLVHLLYRNRIEGLKEQLDRERGRPQPPAQAATPNLATSRPEYDDDQRRHQALTAEMAMTAHNVGHALGERNEHGIQLAVPGLRATLLSLSKAYDVAIPNFPRDAKPVRCLKAGARYLGEVGALLRLGHVDEARQCAAELVPILDSFISGESLPPGQAKSLGD